MKKIFSLVILAAAVVSIQSCSKEKRLERMIYKNDGGWNITTMTYTYVSTDENNVSVTVSATAENAGTFTFDKEGTGTYSITTGNVTHSQSFGWSTSGESFSVAKISTQFNFITGDMEQLIVAFGGEKSGKNQMELAGTETIQTISDSGISQTVLTVNMTLNKK